MKSDSDVVIEQTENRLRPGVLSTVDVVAQSFALMGPVTIVAFVTNLVAGSTGAGAGTATPLAMLLAGLVCVAIGYVIAQFARRVHAAGCIYDYVGYAFGPKVGSMAGWVYLCALGFLFCPGLICGLSGWITDFAARYAHIMVPWYPVALSLCLPLFLLTVIDVRIATRTQLVISLVSVAVVMLVVVWIFVRGGHSGLSAAPFIVNSAPRGWQGFAFGLIYAMAIYAGFESSATLAEETANPARAMPIAIIGSVSLAASFYIVVTYAYAIGFGVENASKWGSDANVLVTMTQRYVGTWLVPIVFLAAIVDAFAAGLALLNGASRVCYAMARDGLLLRPLGRTHSRYQTPHVAIASLLVTTALIALPFAHLKDGAIMAFGYLGGIAGIVLQVIYIFVAIAMMTYFRRNPSEKFCLAAHGIVPVVAILGCCAALYGSLQGATGSLFSTMPYVAIAILASSGLVWLRLRGQTSS